MNIAFLTFFQYLHEKKEIKGTFIIKHQVYTFEILKPKNGHSNFFLK